MTSQTLTYGRIAVVIGLLLTITIVALFADTPSNYAAIITPFVALIGLTIAFLFAKNGIEAVKDAESSVLNAQTQIDLSLAEIRKAESEAKLAAKHALSVASNVVEIESIVLKTINESESGSDARS